MDKLNLQECRNIKNRWTIFQDKGQFGMIDFDEFISQNKSYCVFLTRSSPGIPCKILNQVKIEVTDVVKIQFPFYEPLLLLFKTYIIHKSYNNKVWTIPLSKLEDIIYFCDVLGIPYSPQFKAAVNYDRYYQLEPLFPGLFLRFNFNVHQIQLKGEDLTWLSMDPLDMINPISNNECSFRFPLFKQLKGVLFDMGYFITSGISNFVFSRSPSYILQNETSELCTACHANKSPHNCRYVAYFKCQACSYHYTLFSYTDLANCTFCKSSNSLIFKHPRHYVYTNDFNIVNKHPLDKHIQFEAFRHTYLVYQANDFTSVTTFIHKFFPPFVEDDVVARMGKSIADPASEYHQKTESQIKEVWRINRNLGTWMHLCIEHILMGVLNSHHTMLSTLPTEYSYFMGFLEDLQRRSFSPFKTEWRIFDRKRKICGSIDALFIKDGEIYMFDWKRSKEIRKSSFGMGFEPIQEIPDCNYYHYSLQLNLYKFIIEQNYGIKIKEMNMVVIHPNQTASIVVPIEDMRPTILKMIKYVEVPLDLALLSVDEQ